MKKYLSATKGQREHLMKIFGCCDRMVRDALSYRSDTELAQKIRKAAKENGCPTYRIGLEMETIFDSDGAMHQVFPNGAEIEVDKELGKVNLVFRGEIVEAYGDIHVSEIKAIQQKAKSL